MKRRKLKLGRILLLIFIIFVIIYFFYNRTEKTIKPPKIIYSKFSDNITYQGNSSDYTNVKNKVIDFLNLYYKSIYYLKINDFDKYFNSETELNLFNKALNYQISNRKKSINNLKLTKASYDLEFTNINENEYGYEVTVYENSTVNFKFMEDITTKYYDIINIFTFDNEYKLVSYRREQDFYTIFTENLEDNFTVEDIDMLYDEIINKKELNDLMRTDNYNLYLENPLYNKPICDNPYNRDKALEYAINYINVRNTNDWDVYDDIGGNCQNFASQVINNGGIPMDSIGNTIWKYYGSSVDNKNTKSGRSSSWTTVPYFYDYAKNNTGYGLCAEVDVNIYYAEPGDIIQMGSDSTFVHSTVAIGSVKKDDKILDILLNSNTADYENVPLSSTTSPELRLIKINGWNN